MVIAMSSFNNPMMAIDKKDDVRVRTEENKVRVSLFNGNQSIVGVKIYDENRNVVRDIDLGNGLTPGIILDFKDSEKQYYRFVLTSGNEVVYDNKIKLGTY